MEFKSELPKKLIKDYKNMYSLELPKKKKKKPTPLRDIFVMKKK
jgi:hypothetical protein